jgi:hypothetical protein
MKYLNQEYNLPFWPPKVPREASVIGRVINAWLPFGHNQALAKGAK